MRRVSAVNAGVDDRGILEVELSDGRLICVVFDEYGIPHAGRKLTTSTSGGYIVEMILPYDVQVIATIPGHESEART